jgi:hypothetical protein
MIATGCLVPFCLKSSGGHSSCLLDVGLTPIQCSPVRFSSSRFRCQVWSACAKYWDRWGWWEGARNGRSRAVLPRGLRSASHAMPVERFRNSVADRAHAHRHAVCVLCPSESCRRACSSGVECARITQRNATVATVNTTNVSSALMPFSCLAAWNRVFRSGRTSLQGVR